MPTAPISTHASSRSAEITGWTLSLAVCLGGLWMILSRKAAGDFQTYQYAAQMVIQGRGREVFEAYIPPNRYLYIPGLAWLAAPLGLLQMKTAFVLWTMGVIASVAGTVQLFKKSMRKESLPWLWAAAFGPFLVARPLLYVFLHGTIDWFIMAVMFWALLLHGQARANLRSDPRGESARGTRLAWFLFTVLSIAKLLTLPLMAIPWISTRGIPRQILRKERLAQISAVLLILILPIFTEGFTGAWALLLKWQHAVIGRGMPTDSHNQSFLAFLYHWFSGDPIDVLALDAQSKAYGSKLFSERALELIGTAWAGTWIVIGLAWQRWGLTRFSPLSWASILVALALLPSHIAWKPYFVFTLPVFVLSLAGAWQAWEKRRSPWRLGLVILCAALLNLSTFDFVGVPAHVFMELACVFLWVHLACLALAFSAPLGHVNNT